MSTMSALLMPNSIIYLGCSLQLQFLLNISWYKAPINSNVMHDFFTNNDIQNNNT